MPQTTTATIAGTGEPAVVLTTGLFATSVDSTTAVEAHSKAQEETHTASSISHQSSLLELARIVLEPDLEPVDVDFWIDVV